MQSNKGAAMNSDEAMGQPRLRTSLHMNAVATLSLVILFHTALHAQERRNDVVITADGMEYIGHIVVDSTTYIRWIRPGGEIDYLQFRSGLRRPGATQDKILVGDGSGTWVEGTIKDTTHGMIYIRERDGTLDTLIRRGDEVYSSLELVRMEPERGIDYGDSLPLPGPDTCYARTRPWYFLEMRVLGVKEKSSLDPGAECALGFRIGSFGIGLGASRLKLDDAWRTPGFLHLKYYFSENCVKPILYAASAVTKSQRWSSASARYSQS